MGVVINRIDDKSGPPVFTVVHGKRQRAFVSLRDALAVSEVLLSPGAGESALTTPELKADFRALADIDKRISRDPISNRDTMRSREVWARLKGLLIVWAWPRSTTRP